MHNVSVRRAAAFTSLYCVLSNYGTARVGTCDSQEFLSGGLDGGGKRQSCSVREADGAKKKKKKG